MVASILDIVEVLGMECNCLNCAYKRYLTDDGSETGETVIWCGLNNAYIGYLDEASCECCNDYEPDFKDW